MKLWTPTLRQRWLVTTLALTAGCSPRVSSTSTVSSLQPDAPTSAPALSSDDDDPSDAGPLGSPETLTATSEGAPPVVDAATSATPSVPEVNTSKVVEPDTTGEPETTAAPSIDEPEAGATTITVVDGQLPELSPWETEPGCGIPVENGPPMCDPIANCGCEDDRTCAYTPERTRVFTCVVPGATADGDACDDDDACTRGSVCVSGLCAPTCEHDEDCVDAACVAVAAGEDYVENLRVCSAPCDPLTQGACGEGATCANAPGSAVFTCIRQETAAGVNAACEATRDCQPGLGCAADGVCRSWCALSEPAGDAGTSSAGAPPCPEDSECLAFDARADLGMCSAACTVPDVEGSECGLVPTSCGCDSGETCQVSATGKTQCGAPGERDAMDWCSSNADCGEGLSCVAQLCRPICDPELLPCADGSGCVQANSGASPAACLGHCDPVHPDSAEGEFSPCGVGAYCSPGFGNIPALDESYCTRQSDTPADEGKSCSADLECDNGFGCDAQTDSCLRWCRDTEDCGTGQACDLDISPGRTGSDADPVGFCRAL